MTMGRAGITLACHASVAAQWARTIGVLLAAACLAVGAPAQSAPPPFGNPAVWHWAPSRSYHVVDYRLSLHFDEPRGVVFGDEVVTLRPFGAGFRTFYLNSAGLTIDTVRLEGGGVAEIPLSYTTDASRLWITLDRAHDARTTLRVRVIYHGAPRTGLFFVNPTSAYPNAPREVFSQGEPELNHFGSRAGTTRTTWPRARPSPPSRRDRSWSPTAAWCG